MFIFSNYLESKSEMYNYYLKIVPTVYVKPNEAPINTNQFSVTRYRKDLSNKERGMPGIFFSYELSPLMVKYEEQQRWYIRKNTYYWIPLIFVFIFF